MACSEEYTANGKSNDANVSAAVANIEASQSNDLFRRFHIIASHLTVALVWIAHPLSSSNGLSIGASLWAQGPVHAKMYTGKADRLFLLVLDFLGWEIPAGGLNAGVASLPVSKSRSSQSSVGVVSENGDKKGEGMNPCKEYSLSSRNEA